MKKWFFILTTILILLPLNYTVLALEEMQGKGNPAVTEYYNAGNEALAKDNYKEALSFFKKALEIDNTWSPLNTNIGICYINLHRLKEAETYLKKAVELDSSFSLAHYNLARLYKLRGRFDKTVYHYKKVLELEPEMIPVYIKLAELYFTRSLYKEAGENYEKLITLNRENAPFFNFRVGLCFEMQGKLDEAEHYYREALEKDPNNTDALLNLGNLYIYKYVASSKEEDFQEAIANFKKVIEIDPSCLKAYLNLGSIYREKGELDESVTWYEKALEISPDNALIKALLEDLANLKKQKEKEYLIQLAQAYFSGGLYQEACENYKSLITLDPENASLYNQQIGAALQMQGRLEEAIYYYEEAVKKDPNNSDVFFNLGNIYRSKYMENTNMDDFEKAVLNFKKVIEIKPDYLNAYLNLGYIFKEKGDIDESIRWYEKLVECSPDNKIFKTLLEDTKKQKAAAEKAKEANL